MVVLDLLFFFSSRRRHTRSTRDWSSDVCSSDLNDQASMRAGLDGEEKFPAPIKLQRPTPSVLSLVSYRSGSPKPWPVSWATVPIGMMSVPVHESEPPSPLWRT